MKLRLLSIAHSYTVGLNRRLPHWIAKIGSPKWEVVAVAPVAFPGDLAPIRTVVDPSEAFVVHQLRVNLARHIHFFFYSLKLRELLNGSWNIVHMWEEPYIIAGGQIAALTPKKVPLVYWTAQNIAKNYVLPFAQIERFCFRRARGWLAMGLTTMEVQTKRGFVGKPSGVIPLFVDTDSFRPDREAGASIKQSLGWDERRTPIVGYVGRFVTEKGLNLLMSALDEVEAPWRALFVGGGPMKSAIDLWAKRYGDKVRVLTGVSHHQVPAYMNAIDVLCVPSQTTQNWREQFGRVIAEAFSSGVPVIGSDSGEIPYVIGDAGIVVGESDRHAWTDALERLLGDERQRRDLSVAARARAISHYSCPRVARQYIEFFERILDADRSIVG